jgi:hypothetical protein
MVLSPLCICRIEGLLDVQHELHVDIIFRRASTGLPFAALSFCLAGFVTAMDS